MQTVWFKRKQYGLGWVPSSWQGWLVMVLYVVMTVLIFKKIDATSHSGSDTLIGFAFPFIILTVLLLCITYLTGESPRWQWGKDDHEKKG